MTSDIAGYLSAALIVISVVLTGLILLQTRGSGLGGSMFGGDSSVYRTRRGMEKTLYNMTIVFAVLFLLTSLMTVLLS